MTSPLLSRPHSPRRKKKNENNRIALKRKEKESENVMLIRRVGGSITPRPSKPSAMQSSDTVLGHKSLRFGFQEGSRILFL
jgi:hypothetical protein